MNNKQSPELKKPKLTLLDNKTNNNVSSSRTRRFKKIVYSLVYLVLCVCMSI